jgi:hypothetical protein
MSRVEETQMKRSEKSDTAFPATCASMFPMQRFATFTHTPHPILISVVEIPYTTIGNWPQPPSRRTFEDNLAFVRRKGNAYYLVHNVRRGGKVRQLHLARLGDRARITDDVVKAVSKKHPFIDLNWRSLREQLDNQIHLADPQSPAVQKLVQALRALNIDLADLFPQMLRLSESPAVARELLVQLRLLHSTIQVKLDQFGSKDQLKRMHRTGSRFGSASQDFRGR